MRDIEVGSVVRALRRRRGWRQVDAAGRARVHRSTWSNLERGRLDRLTLDVLRRCLDAVEVRLDLVPRWHGVELDRLLDEQHARLQAELARRLREWGWLVEIETSFNHYGDRGRIDLLAHHPRARVLLVVEVKSDIADAQGLLGALDVKARVARGVAAERGLPRPELVLPLLLVPDTPTIRRRISRVEPLFARFALRGRAAAAALRRPEPAALRGVTGMLLFSNRAAATRGSRKAVGAQRVRLRRVAPSTDDVVDKGDTRP